ncbi:tetratricopeptide repeat protein [Streptomyces thermocarboxydovorans]
MTPPAAAASGPAAAHLSDAVPPSAANPPAAPGSAPAAPRSSAAASPSAAARPSDAAPPAAAPSAATAPPASGPTSASTSPQAPPQPSAPPQTPAQAQPSGQTTPPPAPEPHAAPGPRAAAGTGAASESGAAPEANTDSTSAPAGEAPVRDSAPTFPLRVVPEPHVPSDSAPTFRLRALAQPEDAVPPGTVVPPTGAFGPPPAMDAKPHPAPAPEAGPREEPEDLGPDPKPTPPRGFDAVAEAVLGDEPLAVPDEARLAEPMGRINDAVREGRIDEAARLAEQTMTDASAELGPEHPEVLRLGELTAYIAYLAGEPVRAFRLSLDLAGICRRTGDTEAAYGNVRSAATAWRAVRDPRHGLELGEELIALWTEIAAEGGPAADEIEELESARARMGRLSERAGRD